MLDPDDEQIIKDAKEGGAIIVTWDRVVRMAAGGITPYEVLDQVTAAGIRTKEARAEVSRLHKLTPSELKYPCPAEGCPLVYDDPVTLKRHTDWAHPELEPKEVK